MKSWIPRVEYFLPQVDNVEPNPPAPAEMLPLERAEAVAVEDAEDVEGAEEVDVNRSPDSISVK